MIFPGENGPGRWNEPLCLPDFADGGDVTI